MGKVPGLVAIGLTLGNKLVNKRTSSTAASTTAHVLSFETTKSGQVPQNLKLNRWRWLRKSWPRIMSLQSVSTGMTSRHAQGIGATHHNHFHKKSTSSAWKRQRSGIETVLQCRHRSLLLGT